MNTWVTTPGSRRHFARRRASRGAAATASSSVEVVRPLRCRHLGHAAEQALRRPRAHQHEPVGAPHHEGCAAAQPPFPLRRLERKASPDRRARAPRTAPSTGRARRPVSSACRWWRRGPSAPARSRRCARPGPLPAVNARISGLAAGSSRSTCEQPRHHPLDIAVDRRSRRIERDRRDRRRGVGADAGQRGKLGLACRKLSAMDARPPPWRRHADCGRARNSRARPTA